ncbi:nucleotide sugar dehydrogenase [Vreelandella neptunia]|uniref:Nucleotide sugar dehydrogenase n=1 Tax=Vreelandella neptunia TaxID=115551 RepID=A0ABS9SB57_9GAMM|nr:nucleotide sugar dehydrogenase [Halomonas neptunia]MCH4813327.1 nucleotide sugar dehydrogenase [Halomonas neptunia]
MSLLMNLMKKIELKNAYIGVFGLGYVGIPLSFTFLERGYGVIGFDVNPDRIMKINEGVSYLSNIENEKFLDAKNKNFFATCDFELTHSLDVLILCVPTPIDKNKNPDTSYIVEVVNTILPYLKAGQLIVLESTSYPGTTEELIQTKLEMKGFKIGEDFFLCYSPEREDPGNLQFSTSTIPKLCSGVTLNCLEVGVALYETVIEKVITVSSPKTAEMAKLLENVYRSVNIGLVNEMKILADFMDIDIHEVIKAAATKPFGFVAFKPGPGLGGHCIPVDPFYLIWKSKEFDCTSRIVDAACEVNDRMPTWIVNKIIHSLNIRGEVLNDAKILLLGMAYKKNVSDVRESPSLKILTLLMKYGLCIDYCDPHVDEVNLSIHPYTRLKGISLDYQCLVNYSAVVIVCDHDIFDYELILERAQLIIDTRGVYSGSNLKIVSI